MLRTLAVSGDSFPLKSPFRISRGVKTAADVVTVTISADGIIGRGEGVPYPRYGETVESAIAAIEQARSAIESGTGRAEINAIMAPSAARNAVDCALWDLEARLAGRSVTDLLGLPPVGPTPTALTVGLDEPAAMAAAARSMADVPLIKVKVDRSDPAAQIRAVRAAAPWPKMIVDPNESWTIAEVRELQGFLQDMRVDLLEQPLPADEDAALEGFASAIRIAADESAHVAGDIDALMARYQVVNIKLDKTGGLTAALQLAQAAQARGMGLMTGCMVCSSLSIAPALIVAASAEFVDLDGPLWLANDRPGGVNCMDGMLHPGTAALWGGA